MLFGAGYADVHARLPALGLLSIIAVLAALGFFWNARARVLWIPGLALALMVTMSGAQAADDAKDPNKYPNWKGQWSRINTNNQGQAVKFDPSKPSGLGRKIELLFMAAVVCVVIGVGVIGVAFALTGGRTSRGEGTLYFTIAAAFEGLAGLIALVAWILILVWMARAWNRVPEEFGGMSGLKAVGLLFVPFFNIYWMFRVIPGLSTALTRALQSRDPDTPA